jgi:hypothetical protein
VRLAGRERELGTTRWVVSSFAPTAGVKGTFAQPVGVNVADCVVSASIVVVAGMQDVGSVMNVLESVRSSDVSDVSGPLSSWGIVESRPPSGRSETVAWLRTWMPSAATSMPSRAGSPVWGTRL